MEATVGSRASSRGAGLDLRKVKEVSRTFVFYHTAFAFVPSLPIPHTSLHKHLDECQSHCIVLLVQQEPAVIREWREKQVRLDQPGKNWKDFQLLPRFEKMRGESLSFAGGEVEDQGRGGGGGEDSVEAAGGQGLVQTIIEELCLC